MMCPRRAEGLRVEGGPDEWKDGRCSFCGSMAPDAFMAAARAGSKLGPTDKNYKVYVGDRDKFYFQHLPDEDRTAFVDLLNAKTLNIDFPGRFYVLPFFVVKG